MNWTIQPGYYESHLDDWFLVEGVPVLVHSSGYYPQLVNDRGESTHDVPHLAITYCARTTHTKAGPYPQYTEVAVTGHYPPDATSHGRYRQRVLWHRDLPEVEDVTPYLEEARRHLDLEAFRRIPAAYQAAFERIAQSEPYRGALSRAEYEAACRALGVAAHPDERCSEWGEFAYPQYLPDQVVEYRLRQWRALGIEQEVKAKARPLPPEKVPEPNGQLWEPCELCGREPIYMPLHVCLDCWPKEPNHG